MKKLENTAVLMEFGFWGYPLMEIMFRGWSHWSMALAGSLCFGILGDISQRMDGKNILLKCAVGAAMITTVEFAFGCIFNLGLHMQVWDYSEEVGNFMGQICPRFTAIWFLLSAPLMAFADLLTGGKKGEIDNASGDKCTEYLYNTGLFQERETGDSDTAGNRA